MLRAIVVVMPVLAIAPAIARAEIPRRIADIIRAEADRVGLDPVLLLVIAELESGGDPASCTGSDCGVFQLGRAEFRRYGGGDIFDARDNARAAADMIADQVDDFRAEHGRDPTWTEVYLTHQQGRGGLTAHVADPERLAWRSMWSTAEGRARCA